MGTPGLLPHIPWLCIHLATLAGLRVGIDGTLWLFRAVSAYKKKLRFSNLRRCNAAAYFITRVQHLRRHGITPVIVFDGVFPPARRARQRSGEDPAAATKQRIRRMEGVEGVDYKHLAKKRHLLPLLARLIRDAFEQHEDPNVRAVQFITTPYEGDTQLAYLASLPATDPHHVHAVITEDSDLLAFGVERVLYRYSDECDQVFEMRIHNVLAGMQDVGLPRDPNPLSFKGWAFTKFWAETRGRDPGPRRRALAKFQAMCALGGCEYLDNVPGVRLRTAHALMSEFTMWETAVVELRNTGCKVPPDYEERFQRALWYFKHAVVYSPGQRKLVYLTPLPEEGLVMPAFEHPVKKQQRNGHSSKRRKLDAEAAQQQDSSTSGEESGGGEETDNERECVQDEEGHRVLGRLLPDAVAQGIAEGRLNPVTRRPFALPPPMEEAGQRGSGRSVLGGAGAAAAGRQEDDGAVTDDPEDRLAEKECEQAEIEEDEG